MIRRRETFSLGKSDNPLCSKYSKTKKSGPGYPSPPQLNQAALSISRRLSLRDIRVGGIADAIECPHTVTITGVPRQPGVREAGDIRPYLSNLHKVRAVIAGATLNPEAIFVSRVIGPGQVDLAGRNWGGRQVARRRRC